MMRLLYGEDLGHFILFHFLFFVVAGVNDVNQIANSGSNILFL